MLERYDVKMSCTVLRREKAGNRFFLSDAEIRLTTGIILISVALLMQFEII
ncbi:MAG: hypothetical protein PHG79_03300 [Methanosarcina sp.]|nr:hypothetical protein [Methanosarcina sp.]MDD3873811.1 hypothetical protein [Methanosarcina sp.]MDD4522304.1 hypothetical protein [Methanosarcina sp.]